MSDIKNCLNLTWVLSKTNCNYTHEKDDKKIALVIHIYYSDLISYCYRYALSMPPQTDVYVTTNSEEKSKKIDEVFKRGAWRNFRVILVDNRGHDVSALWVGAAPYIKDYDYVCFAHDKKVPQLDFEIEGYCFSERCFENVLASQEYVNNIVGKFESEPYLGLLCPPPPNHGHYYITAGCEWGNNYDITKKLYTDLGLRVPITGDKEPIAPLGAMFWFRPKALKKFFDKGWDYIDFPEKLKDTDGTISHGIERIYPFVAQDAGYYTAYCLTDEYAQTELTNLNFMLRNINCRLFAICGLSTYNIMLMKLDRSSKEGNGRILFSRWRTKIKAVFKFIIPSFIWKEMRRIYRSCGGKKWIG